MKTIIAGSRSIKDYRKVKEAIESCPWLEEITEVVSGGAVGVDRAGERWAMAHYIPIKRFVPDYTAHANRYAPILRNQEMAEYGEAAIVIWNHESRGTQNMLDLIKKRNLRLYLVTLEGKDGNS